MSIVEPYTKQEIKRNFKRCLKNALVSGAFPPTDEGIDWETEQVLIEIALSYPNADSKLVTKAKNELTKQLNGLHTLNIRGLK